MWDSVNVERHQENIALAPFTTLGIGGPSRWFARATYADELTAACGVEGEQLFVLGGGSNLVVADEGFRGLVLQIAISGVNAATEGDDVIVTAGAGESWDSLVEFAVKQGLAGIECLSGIPGTVGGTPIQNVGAYGQEVATVIESVTAYDRATRTAVRLSRQNCGFAYRMSRFKREDAGRFVISEVVFRFKHGAPATVTYPDVVDYLAQQHIARPTLGNVRDAVLQIRRRKGMVLDPVDPDTRSVGSFFMNPVVDRAAFERIAPAPHYLMDNDAVKIPAAWLIQQSGFARGHVEGPVGLSTKHPLAIINRGGATARDVVRLAQRIKRAVRERFDVNLRPEPVFVGFSPADEDIVFLTS
jgi:UDP-N-acetylmuramate dehydrogenase